MRVLFAAGGTAGHINPALSIAETMKKRRPDAEIRFAGNPSGMENRLVPQAGYRLHPVEVRGFRRQLSLYNVGTVRMLIKALRESEEILREFKPDLVVGAGGYVSGPVVYRAAKDGIPTAIHEQNAFPGVTTRILSRYADKIMVTTPDCVPRLKNQDRIAVTGMPVREDFIFYKRDPARRELALDGRPLVLSYGGSLGAHRLNEAVLGMLAEHWRAGRVHFMHATGKTDYAWFMEQLSARGIDPHAENVHIREYIDDMPRCYAAADLVICRSGASTLSELAVQAKPSILVPSPNVTANHQYYNAMGFVKRGAALLAEDRELTGETLSKRVTELLADPSALRRMSAAAASLAVFDANDRIYRALESVMR